MNENHASQAAKFITQRRRIQGRLQRTPKPMDREGSRPGRPTFVRRRKDHENSALSERLRSQSYSFVALTSSVVSASSGAPSSPSAS